MIASAALTELLLRSSQNKVANNPVWQTNALWRSNVKSSYPIKFKLADQDLCIRLTSNNGTLGQSCFTADINGEKIELSGEILNKNLVAVELQGKKDTLAFSQSKDALTIFKNGKTYAFHYIKNNYSAEDSAGSEGNLKAPMPGAITQVFVTANQSVKKDEVLLTLEAMKMEYAIRAPFDGVVIASYFQKGDQVKAGDELVEFQALEEVA